MYTETSVDLLRRWQRQIGARRRAPRGLAALGVLVGGPRARDLVPIERITLVVLYDLPRGSHGLALRVGGFTASRVSHGVQWGSPANRRFSKDLALQPAPHGQGYQLDLFDAEAVDLALRLNWRIDTALRYQRSAARASMRLPRLWAGFAADAAAEVRGDGPELAALAARFDLPAEALMAKFRRERSGQTLYPLDWVSHQAQQAATVWAELSGFPQRQVFGLNRSASQLVGYAGAAAFNFSERETRRQVQSRGRTAAVAAG